MTPNQLKLAQSCYDGFFTKGQPNETWNNVPNDVKLKWLKAAESAVSEYISLIIESNED